MLTNNDENIVAQVHNDVYGQMRDDTLIKGMVTELQNTPKTTKNGTYDVIEAQFEVYFDQPMNFYMPEDIYHIKPFKASQTNVYVRFYRYELLGLIYTHSGSNTLLEKIKNCIGLSLRNTGFDAPFNMDEVKFTVEYKSRC